MVRCGMSWDRDESIETTYWFTDFDTSAT